MKKSIAHFILFSLLMFIAGGLIGYSAGHFKAVQATFPEIIPIQDTNPHQATIHLMEAKNGTLTGKVEGQKARIAYSSEHILELAAGESFEIPLSNIDLQLFYLESQIPANTHFIASKSGKYYYHVLDKRSLGITPKNRVFFKTQEEAERAGYLKRK